MLALPACMARGFLALVHADDQRQVARQLHPLPGSSGHRVPRCQFRLGNGESAALDRDEQHAHQLAGPTGHAQFAQRHQRAPRTEQQLQLAASVFVHAREGIMITDAEAISLTSTTPLPGSLATAVLGFEGQNPRMLRSGRHDREFYAAPWRSLLDKGHWYGEIWNKRKMVRFSPKCRPSAP